MPGHGKVQSHLETPKSRDGLRCFASIVNSSVGAGSQRLWIMTRGTNPAYLAARLNKTTASDLSLA